MNELLIHTDDEKRVILELTEVLTKSIDGGVESAAYKYIHERTSTAIADGKITRDGHGQIPPNVL